MAEPRDSYSRCLMNPGFLDRFYEIFLASDPIVAPLFRNTDFEHQKTALRHMLTTVVMFDSGNEIAVQGLARMARLHGPDGLAIPKHLYERWADSLLAAVGESDPGFSAEAETAWRDGIAKAIEFMIANQA